MEPGRFIQTIAITEPDLPDNRLNEGRVAPDGSFWVGTMQDNISDAGKPKPMKRDSGAYYRIGSDLAVKQLTPREYGITNTMAWLPDGRFVTADTTKNALYAFDYDADDHALRTGATFRSASSRDCRTARASTPRATYGTAELLAVPAWLALRRTELSTALSSSPAPGRRAAHSVGRTSLPCS